MAYHLEGVSARPDHRRSHRTTATAARQHSLRNSRARLRFALGVCLGLAGLLAFVVFPARRLTLQVDGQQIVVHSRDDDPASVLSLAGVQAQAGDTVVQSASEVKVERALPVTIDVDGRSLSLRTRSPDVASLLHEAGVDLGANDTLLVNGSEATASLVLPLPDAADPNAAAAPLADFNVSIRRAVPITIVYDGNSRTVQTSRLSLDQVLADAGVKLVSRDQVSLPLTTAVAAGLEVDIVHPKAVTVQTGDKVETIDTLKPTLKDALVEGGWVLGPDDRVSPSLDAPVTDGMSATVVHVQSHEYVETKPVPRKTVFKPDDDLTGMATRIVSGHDGIDRRQFKVITENGVDGPPTLEKEWMEPDVDDNVIYYASASIKATGFTPGDLQVTQTDHMYATWYSASNAGKAPTDPAYGIAKEGMPVTRGVVAVDPRVIPLGSHLFVPGYGFAIAGDTGGGIIGDRIDLGFADGAPVDWRTDWVDVYVLSQ